MRLNDPMNRAGGTVLLVAGAALVMSSCRQGDRAPEGRVAPAAGVIEVLTHDDGRFSVAETVAIDGGTERGHLGGLDFTIEERWPHAEKQQLVTDDRPDVHHGVEVAPGDPGEPARWIYQSDRDDLASTIPAVDAVVRVTAPGARSIDPGEEDPLRAVQFLRDGRLHDLPAPGGILADPWTVTEIRTFRSGLLEEDGSVRESEDGNFVNRVVEVRLSDGRGTTERHLAFLDHPQLTRGIHPTLLPVTRLEGDQASNSRLVACEPVPSSDSRHHVHLTPHIEGEGLTARILGKGSSTLTVTEVDEYPAELSLPGSGALRILRHYSHAHPHLKWVRAEPSAAAAPHPALVVSHRAGHHQLQRFVLREGEITPCRAGGKYLWLRYRSRTAPGDVVAPTTTPSIHHEDTNH